MFYLNDKLGLPQSEVPGLIFRSMLVQSSMVVALSVLGGRLSDALRRRKAFVIGGALVYALGLWIVALADSYAMFGAGRLARDPAAAPRPVENQQCPGPGGTSKLVLSGKMYHRCHAVN